MAIKNLEKIQYPIKKLANGDDLNLRAFRVTGTEPGPHVHIQASVHGAEVQGNAVIFRLLEFFENHEFNGTITFIPMANPTGINNKQGPATQGRFNPQSGTNWNRSYEDITKSEFFNLDKFLEKEKSLIDKAKWSAVTSAFKKYLVEVIGLIQNSHKDYGVEENKKLGLLLQKIAAPADIVLDLHTGPIACRYLYCGEHNKNRAPDMGFPFNLIIPDEFGGAMDEATFMPWVILNQALDFELFPFESYTVELGSEERIDLDEATEDAALILNFLKERGMLSKENTPKAREYEQKACYLKDYKTYYSQKAGLVEYLQKPGDAFKEETLLYQVLNMSHLTDTVDLGDCLTEVKAQAPGLVINHHPSSVIMEGAPVYQVMENYFDFKKM